MNEFNKKNWALFKEEFKQQYNESPSVLSVLFLIGLSEIDTEQTSFTKEEKQDVIHVGLCKLLESEGVYQKENTDADGWPHYKVTERAKSMDIEKQEPFLRQLILNYFDFSNQT